MSSNTLMVGHDLYYSITNRDGSRIERARVWDSDRFMASQRAAGAKPKEEADRYTVAFSSGADYEAQQRAAKTGGKQ